MVFTFNRGSRRTARGKLVKTSTTGNIFSVGALDMTYDTALHRNAVLRDLRSLTDPKRWRKYKYKIDQAKYIKEAILREAPLLTGFFADEPSWRSKVLLWCDKVLAHHVTKNS